MTRPGRLLVWLVVALVLAVLVALVLWERVPTIS
jgi:hypothetical protein